MKIRRKTAIRVIAIVAMALFLLCMMVLFAGCNKQLVDLTWSYERAIIFLPNGEKIEGKISSWDDFEGSDMIHVKINGKTYLTHSSNVILISE